MKTTIVKIISWIVLIAFGALAGIGFLNVLIWGADKAMQGQEKYECNQWSRDALEYPGFYQTDWQKEQCARYDIIIKAPIK